jgi:hypothetical protein
MIILQFQGGLEVFSGIGLTMGPLIGGVLYEVMGSLRMYDDDIRTTAINTMTLIDPKAQNK